MKSAAKTWNGNSIVSNKNIIIEMPVNLAVSHLVPTKRKLSLTKTERTKHFPHPIKNENVAGFDNSTY